MPVFDAYLIVDWSAAARPKTGSDSVWYCFVLRKDSSIRIQETVNPPTRAVAVELIKEKLVSLSKQGLVTLVGFDFPYAYPVGLAGALGLDVNEPWLAVWDEVSKHIVDESDNSNNRFEVASSFNERISGGPAPFWGCPENKSTKFLAPKKPVNSLNCGLAEYRLTDFRIHGAQSPWKLYGTGSAGGQTLMGIPAVRSLRYDPELAHVSKVWPFETGFRAIGRNLPRDTLIIHAEIYPSICKVVVGAGQVKDKLQVEALAVTLGEWDIADELSDRFECPADLTEDERIKVETEEGWILGVR